MNSASHRRAELAHNLSAVRGRIARTSARFDRAEPELIVVTKFFPAEDARLLYDLGMRDFGENKEQEAAPKARALERPEPRWHFIGQLQRNKAKSVASFATAVHSVDRPALAVALSQAVASVRRDQERAGEELREDLKCFLQVNLSSTSEGVDAARGGAPESQILSLAAQVDQLEGLSLAGVMAVAPLGADPGEAFERLAAISQQVRANYPAATGISAGMSHDLEAAIENGATHLRIGSDVLGPRPKVR